MKNFIPMLFTSMKSYSKDQLVKDIIAGIIVAIIALPLSIALAIASGVGPEAGIYTAIIAGFLAAFFGGSKVQIAGPTAAFATIVAGIVAKDGTKGLMVATILAGIFLVIMGICRFGNLLKFIPFTITTGFTAGIAVTLLIGQIKDFAGIQYMNGEAPIETTEKISALISNFGTIKLQAVLIGALALAILIIWPRFVKKIPGSLIAVIVTALLVKIFNMDVVTIGKAYASIPSGFPGIAVDSSIFSFDLIRSQIPNAITIALLAGIESLLSAVVADGMINDKHRPNQELVAQGIANIGSACFGGIPATGAIARTAANIKNGGRSPIAGIVHSITLVLVVLFLMPYAKLIPMPCIAAILFQVAYNMCGWRNFVRLVKSSPISDILVLVVTFALTVIFDLVVAIEVGIVLAAILFMKRMSDESKVSGWRYTENTSDTGADSLNLAAVPKHTMIFEISGPMFFAAAEKLLEISFEENTKVLILRMRGVTAVDATAMKNLEQLVDICEQQHIKVVLSHVNEQPKKVMDRGGFSKRIGDENFCEHIADALERAKVLAAQA